MCCRLSLSPPNQNSCTTERDICSAHGVRGYPTLMMFKDGSKEGERYSGGRDLSALLAFLGTAAEEKKADA